MTFQRFCDLVLHRTSTSNVLTGDDLFFAHDSDIRKVTGEQSPEACLSQSEKRFLAIYKDKCADKLLWDLSQNPGVGRGRTSLADGSSMCLTTSSHCIWCGADFFMLLDACAQCKTASATTMQHFCEQVAEARTLATWQGAAHCCWHASCRYYVCSCQSGPCGCLRDT